MKTSKSPALPQKPNPTTLYIVGGVVLVIAATGLYWYYRSRKKKQQTDQQVDPLDTIASASDYQTPPIVPITTKPVTSSTTSGVVIKRGSRHPDVKILQRYLKNRGAYLGKSGVNRDGVDGIFGKLTAKAALQITNKTVFTAEDIQKYKRTL